jgi:hypothetical protein
MISVSSKRVDRDPTRDGTVCVNEASQGSAAMSGWSRVIAAGAAVAMVVSGLFVFEGYRSAWALGAAASVLLVISSSRAGKRSG